MRARLGAWLGCALSVLGVLGVIALSATDHRHRAVMVLVAVLAGMGALRRRLRVRDSRRDYLVSSSLRVDDGGALTSIIP